MRPSLPRYPRGAVTRQNTHAYPGVGGVMDGPRPVPTVSLAQLVLALCRFLSSFFDRAVYDIFAMLLHFH